MRGELFKGHGRLLRLGEDFLALCDRTVDFDGSLNRLLLFSEGADVQKSCSDSLCCSFRIDSAALLRVEGNL
jgi:hypothetical protein